MGLTLMGKYEEALSIGNHAVDRGMRVPNQPLMVTTHCNMIDAYVLTGRVEQARSCLNTAKEWFIQERSFYARQALLIEELSLALMTGRVDHFVETFGILESESQGQSRHFFLHRAVISKYAARRDALLGKGKEAMDRLTRSANVFRKDFPLAYLETLAGMAWLEAFAKGNSPSSPEVLRLLELYDLRGKRATLQLEGFLDAGPCLKC